ncbi:hypothetical protein F2Q69_00036971 [Brassica cretica]|uniref:Uncharacterized protein n=1 Tax=Brassica cretica TaxID=69181 RepID=A0A8S9SQ91_BRACR|nr:hypothetical protein F2Q69_00036971 [Brassica cretica]
MSTVASKCRSSRQVYSFHGRASPFTSVYVEFETVARFAWLTPLSVDLQSPCSNDVVMLKIKPFRCAHPCRYHLVRRRERLISPMVTICFCTISP